MTARNVQAAAKRAGLPWTVAKGFDTFLPVGGPVAVETLLDLYRAELWLSVNGVARQRDSVGLMLWRVPEVLSAVSRVMTLEKGDVVLTGTPKGVGAVGDGDVMEAGITVGGVEIQEAALKVGREGSRGRLV